MCVPGTFYTWDRLSALFEFVRESLVDGWQPFQLIAPGGQKLQESEEISLAESNLVRTRSSSQNKKRSCSEEWTNKHHFVVLNSSFLIFS